MNKFLKIFLFFFCSIYLFCGFFTTTVQATTCSDKYPTTITQCSGDCQSLGSNYLTDNSPGLCDISQNCCHQVTSSSGAASSLELQIPLFDYAQAANLPEYIATIYKYAVIIIIPLAIIMIIIGGILWISAAGNPGSIKKAQKYIFDALIGLAIAFFSYTLFSLVGIENLKMKTVEHIDPEAGDILVIAPSNYTFSPPANVSLNCAKSGGKAAIAQIASSSIGKVTYRLGGKTFNTAPYTANTGPYAKYASYCPENTECLDCSGYTAFILECAGITSYGWKNGQSTKEIFGCDCNASEKITSYTDTTVNNKPIQAGDLIGIPSNCPDIGVSMGHVVIADGNGKLYDCHGGDVGRQPGNCVGQFTLTWFTTQDPSHKSANYRCIRRLP